NPPWTRKSSMPARSVTTWKLTARSALTTAKRTALAISQPATSTAAASSSLGMNAPSCARNARTGSSITSTLSMSASRFTRSGRVQDAPKRNSRPRGPVGQLVPQFVHRLLELQQRQQRPGRFDRREQPGAGGGARVAGKERLPGTGQPLRGQRFAALHLVGALRHPADRGAAGVVERAEHPGDVAKRRVPSTTLLDRPRRFAL